MIGFGPSLNKENIYKRITSYDIFKKYCPEFTEIGRKFKARQESRPSTLIDYYKGDLLYKDFGESGSYRAINYVAKVFNTNYIGALQIINRDFDLGLGTGDVSPINKKAVKFFNSLKEKQLKISPTKILIKNREYNYNDLTYWGQYYWTKEMLKSVDIVPISHFWITKEEKTTQFKASQYTYSYNYYWHEDIFRRKIYQPFNTNSKFVSNVDFSIVQGYKRLNKYGDILIITSSLKDCGPFWRMGYDAIAPNSETSFLPEQFVEKVKNRFKRIIIWFDNDWEKSNNQGIINAKKFSEKYGFEYMYNPDNYPKDPSDFVKEFSLNEFYNYFSTKINY
jgi:hypothetical protein